MTPSHSWGTRTWQIQMEMRFLSTLISHLHHLFFDSMCLLQFVHTLGIYIVWKRISTHLFIFHFIKLYHLQTTPSQRKGSLKVLIMALLFLQVRLRRQIFIKCSFNSFYGQFSRSSDKKMLHAQFCKVILKYKLLHHLKTPRDSADSYISTYLDLSII